MGPMSPCYASIDFTVMIKNTFLCRNNKPEAEEIQETAVNVLLERCCIVLFKLFKCKFSNST